MKKQILIATLVALSIFGCKKSEEHTPEPATTTTATPATIDAPANLDATTDTQAQVTLSWDEVSGATGYKVYWSNETGVTATSDSIDATTNSYAHAELTPNETYYYKVSAVSEDATSDLTEEVSGKVWGFVSGTILGRDLNLKGIVTTPYGPNEPTVSTTAAVTSTTVQTGNDARFNKMYGLSTDGSNLYVAGYNNKAIRKVDLATGVVTVLVSSGLNFPVGVLCNSDGSILYVGGNQSHAVHKVTTSDGSMSVFAGSTTSTSGTITDTTATAARFTQPIEMVEIDGSLYLTEYGNHSIRKIVIETGEVSTFAGSKTGAFGSVDGIGNAATFRNPYGITYDGTNLYVTGSGNHVIRRINPTTAEVTTIAGTAGTANVLDGTGKAALFNKPRGIATDGVNLYVSDFNGHTIRKIVIATGVVTTLAGASTKDNFVLGSANGTGSAATFKQPAGLTVTSDALYVGSYGNSNIRKIQ